MSTARLTLCILYNIIVGREMSPPRKNCPVYWGPEPPLTTLFLGPTRVHIPNRTSVSASILAQLMAVTDRHINDATSV